MAIACFARHGRAHSGYNNITQSTKNFVETRNFAERPFQGSIGRQSAELLELLSSESSPTLNI